MSILVAEDNADCRDLYSIYLGDEHTLRMATDGTEALDELDITVDLVFLDRDMPDMTGTEVAHEIAAMDHDPYVVMVSSMEADFDIVEMPIDGYVQKPVKRSDLQSVIEQCQRQESYEDALDEFFSLTAKLGVIEAQVDDEFLEDSARYQRLKRKVREKRAEVDDALAPGETDWSLAFKTCADQLEATAESQNV